MKKIFLAFTIFAILILVFPQKSYAQIVINEVLPNPATDETQNEWVELYNSGSESVDVNGYILKDASDTHELIIDGSKTGGSTIINTNSWLVIYRKGSSFSLNNTDDETVRLFIPSDLINPINIFSYNGSSENMSWGRIPDGGNISLSKLIVSPGAQNIVPETPTPKPTSSPTQIPKPTSAPTNTPTPTKTTTPIPVPNKTSTPIPLKTLVPRPSPTDLGSVLGTTDAPSSPSVSPKPNYLSSAEDRNKRVAITVIVLGLILICSAAYLAYKTSKSEQV
jgi:hypothetical protein